MYRCSHIHPIWMHISFGLISQLIFQLTSQDSYFLPWGSKYSAGRSEVFPRALKVYSKHLKYSTGAKSWWLWMTLSSMKNIFMLGKISFSLKRFSTQNLNFSSGPEEYFQRARKIIRVETRLFPPVWLLSDTKKTFLSFGVLNGDDFLYDIIVFFEKWKFSGYVTKNSTLLKIGCYRIIFRCYITFLMSGPMQFPRIIPHCDSTMM